MSDLVELNPTELAVQKDCRDKVLAWEEYALTQPQVEIPVNSHVHGGLYARQVRIPAGLVVTGRIYAVDHMDIMISGDITLTSDDGIPKRHQGFNIFHCVAGKKRAAITHEDTIWMTVTATEAGDPEEILDRITVESFEDLAKLKALELKGGIK